MSEAFNLETAQIYASIDFSDEKNIWKELIKANRQTSEEMQATAIGSAICYSLSHGYSPSSTADAMNYFGKASKGDRLDMILRWLRISRGCTAHDCTSPDEEQKAQ
jgi:hypothetical protein